MTTFKVGQRVRIVRVGPTCRPVVRALVGREGTIVAIPSNSYFAVAECDVEIDGAPATSLGFDDKPFASRFDNLAPLTDPKADAFIESVKKWKPEPVVPLPAKVTNFNNIRENAK